MSQLSQAIIRTLVYGDIFDYPLKPEEIGKFLIFSDRVKLEVVRKEIAGLKSDLVGKKEGFYFLKDRERIVDLRRRRQKFSRRKLLIASRWAFFLRIIPWIEAILLTGALSRENADQDDDIDWLVITKPGKLWLTRFLAVLILQIFRARRRPNQRRVKDKICLNMFLDAGDLAVRVGERNLFTAYETLQSRLLWQRGNTYLSFIKANRWTKKYLANAYADVLNQASLLDRERKSRRMILVFFLDLLEKSAFRFQVFYMRSKKTIEKVEASRALFHPQDVGSRVMEEYQERLGKLGISKS